MTRIILTLSLILSATTARAATDECTRAMSAAEASAFAASRTSPTRVSFLMGSEPVFGAVFGWLMFADHLTLHAWIGCALILVATYVVVLAPARAKAKAARA